MADKARLYDHALRARVANPRRVTLLIGPRLVGKTVACRSMATNYLDWENLHDRRIILRGPEAVARHFGLRRSHDRDALAVFDNLHGYGKWKSFVRRFSMHCGARLRLIVTGCAVEGAGGSGTSRAKRYFHLRMHPWSVGECAQIAETLPTAALVRPPAAILDEDWHALIDHGGFPEPFLRRDLRFTRRWRTKWQSRLVGNDVREIAALQDPASFRVLTALLAERSALPLIYSDLSCELGVTVDTVRRWVELLARLQYGFCVRPWFANIAKSLRKEPKWFLRDWSGVASTEARHRTFIACHLLKAVEGWADLGLGRFELRYVRDKLRREVDFLVVRERKPWFLVEVGNHDNDMAATLSYFQAQTRAQHAFRVVLQAPFAATDCFEWNLPTVVSARTLLSQLL
jgi:predicted AAA+ superfamily ATPase